VAAPQLHTLKKRMAVFAGRSRSASSPSNPLLLHLFYNRTSGISATISVKALKRTQSLAHPLLIYHQTACRRDVAAFTPALWCQYLIYADNIHESSQTQRDHTTCHTRFTTCHTGLPLSQICLVSSTLGLSILGIQWCQGIEISVTTTWNSLFLFLGCHGNLEDD